MADVLNHPAADPRCPRCHGLGLDVVRQGARAHALLCSCVGTCPTCKGSGWVSEGDGFRAPRRRCDCRRVELRAQRFDEVGIPARYVHATVTSFTPTKANQLAWRAANAYITRYDPRGDNRGLVLHGAVGRGKTHLMIGILRELVLRYGVSARFVEFTHLLGDLKSSFDRGQGTAEILDPLTRVDVLAIDELGKGRNTAFEGTVLDELVSRRYNALGTILATTNYAPGAAVGKAVPQLAAAEPGDDLPNLVDRVGDRVYSRLREICDFVQVLGEDHRELGRRRAAR